MHKHCFLKFLQYTGFRNNSYSKFSGGGGGGVDNKGNEKMVVTAPFLPREDTNFEVKFCQESFLCPFGRYIIQN